MADEAILNIKVVGGEGGAGGTGGGGGGSDPAGGGSFSIADILKQFRGYLGGTFGKAAGLGLDVMSGAGEGAAAVAGPILAAIEIGKLVNQAMINSVKVIGDFSAALASASDDPSEGIKAMGSGIMKLGEALGGTLSPLGTFVEALGTAANAIGELTGVLDQNVDRYSQFNPQLAMAEARSEVIQILGDMRRAQEVGPGLSKYVQVRTELQQRYEDIKARFIVQIAPIVSKLLALIELHLPLLEVIANLVNALLHPMDFALEKIGVKIDNVTDELRKMGEDTFELATDTIRKSNGQAQWADFDKLP